MSSFFPARVRSKFLIAFLALQVSACATPGFVSAPAKPVSVQDPAELYGELFERVQTLPLFEDSKHFVDMIPKRDSRAILTDFRARSPKTRGELRAFVAENFDEPAVPARFEPPPGQTVDERIRTLWSALKRTPDEEAVPESSLIPLPHPYVVPGGRFREIYYWDSYFTQLGLLADGEDAAFRDMVLNFADMATSLGRIPNGNRDYYRSRSQPPFFSFMVSLWADREGPRSATRFLPALKKEYEFWMSGADGLNPGEARARVVRWKDGVLNRYWDDEARPRPEAYKEDLALAKRAFERLGRPREEVYRDLRAGAESGWDYSTRWFDDPREFATIRTTSLIAVDLNALLFHLERVLAMLSDEAGDGSAARAYRAKAEARKKRIREDLWDEASGTFQDYDWRRGRRVDRVTAATVVPLFTGVATAAQAKAVAAAVEKNLLKPGGIVTTTVVSGQQWDAPNGWAPLQWMAYAGLKRYGHDALAEKIRERWRRLTRKVFKSTGRLMEKYDVIDPSRESGGGEYPLQDGFGWTNGAERAFDRPERFTVRGGADE